MSRTSEFPANTARPNDNFGTTDGSFNNTSSFSPGLWAGVRDLDPVVPTAETMSTLPGLSLFDGNDDDGSTAAGNGQQLFATQLENRGAPEPVVAPGDRLRMPEPDDASDDYKEELRARWEREDCEAEAAGRPPHDPNDAPRGELPGFDATTKSFTYDQDGNVETSVHQHPDGSTSFARYYPPAEVDGVMQSIREEETVTHPDGSSEYRRFSPDGQLDLIQTSNASGHVSTFSRQEDGTYQGRVQFPNGEVHEGTYNADFSPRHVVENRTDGSVSTATYQADMTTRVTTTPDGRRYTYRSTPTGQIIDTTTTEPDGRYRVESFGADRSILTQNFAADGTLNGSYRIPADASGGSGIYRSDGGMLLTMNAPDGTASRTLTIDGSGRVLSESSLYPDGSTREQISYDHGTNTRNIVRYDGRGVVTQRIQHDRVRIMPSFSGN